MPGCEECDVGAAGVLVMARCVSDSMHAPPLRVAARHRVTKISPTLARQASPDQRRACTSPEISRPQVRRCGGATLRRMLRCIAPTLRDITILDILAWSEDPS